MQSAEKTVSSWNSVIADVAVKRQNTNERIEHLRKEKQCLALESAMGSTDAEARLAKINTELTRLAFEVDEFDMALKQAEAERQRAEQAEAAAAERGRQSTVRNDIEQYFAEVRAIDDALAGIVSHFRAAREILQRAESRMTSEERTPLSQLRSDFGATLAAAHYGLSEFIELGRGAAYTAHRQPFQKYALGFVDRWIDGEHSVKRTES
jgi:hypothetical protein